MKRPSASLQARWYKKLKASGFTDVERGRDLNHLPATTMPGNHVSIDAIGIDPENDEDQNLTLETKSLTNSERAQYWRMVQTMVTRIKEPNPAKAFLQDWVDNGDLNETCRDYGYSRRQGQWIVKEFLLAADLYVFKHRGPLEPYEQPGPVRTLTKAEIAKLSYKAPKQIKDSSE